MKEEEKLRNGNRPEQMKEEVTHCKGLPCTGPQNGNWTPVGSENLRWDWSVADGEVPFSPAFLRL
jgi:hypothetical protein